MELQSSVEIFVMNEMVVGMTNGTTEFSGDICHE